MNNSLYVLVLLVVVLIWFFLKRSKTKSAAANKHSTKTIRKEPSFRAVSIQICPQACAAAKNIRDKRFLSHQAPMLPLADCNVKDCKCKFVHHNDRRSHDDRRFASVTMQNVFADKEKRENTKSDRRKK
ncbi:MAG: hypothetical protein DRQ39_02400 [Gammaproteobacteria bacterium]|nr:MAG: hypothetical protein DRQ39_02400 [Gammaproteobacteria bacterium]RKZ94619.1 MAG: hypothetical protein DRQ46_09690 [Gammaproteobacteria bacterium]